ncbi:hypothetical protein SAMN02745702_00361 [Desulfobaculum bizertense DSM 18034]|uniref:Uncharacterized protein n=1 Tax=Desulfobaculum bizertense DSM 18034 TaxID=1121442 RepID=A0A1T4VI69_9BACT|nr:hypothetical protein SAMN02745702_00361 [Desulfobaculum bizertense DSM 18034]
MGFNFLTYPREARALNQGIYRTYTAVKVGYKTPPCALQGGLGRFIGALPQALQGALPLDPAQGRGPWESRYRSKNKAEWDESFAFLSISLIF